MRILLLKIPSMLYYKGAVADDMPTDGTGNPVDPEKVYEKYNFDPVKAPNGEFCLGWFDAGEDEQLPIENIEGVEMEADTAENVLVVWCAPYKDGRTTVVGWYGEATVLRGYADIEFDGGYVQTYNIMDDAHNCVLLPEGERGLLRWNVPAAGEGQDFGMSRRDIWFPTGGIESDFIENLKNNIESYSGENWLYKYPENPEE
ncbi:MAG: hypothetical protein IJ072_04835 [Oscillospiraceae bacterium]|nr:hypothetical protein [Oscillospiraceae bacterium]